MDIVLSTPTLNSYGYRVLTEGIDLAQYKKNPILLWNHNRPYRGTKDEVLPIGRIENLLDGDKLIGSPVFDDKDDFALQIKNKVEGGFIKMASIGIDVIATSDEPKHILAGQRRATVTKCKLIEVSITDIGANDDALVLYRRGNKVELSAGIDNEIVPELISNNNKINSKMKNIQEKLGLSDNATEADVVKAIGDLQRDASESATLKKENEALKLSAIESEVSFAIKARKITEDKRNHFIQLGAAVGLETLKATFGAMASAVKPSELIDTGERPDNKEWQKLGDVPEDERIELRSNDPKEYKRLYRAEYGVDCDMH